MWKDWLLGIEDSADHLDRLRGQLPEGVKNYCVIAIDIEDFDELVTEDQWGDRQLVVFAVRNVAYEILQNREGLGSRFLFASASQIYFLLLGGPCPRDVYESMIYEVRRWVRISISVGISGRAGEFAELPHAFAEAREALLNRWIYGSGLVHEHGELANTEGNGNAPGYPSELDEALVLALREGDGARARKRCAASSARYWSKTSFTRSFTGIAFSYYPPSFAMCTSRESPRWSSKMSLSLTNGFR